MSGEDFLNQLTPEFKAKCKVISAEARSAIRDAEGLCVPIHVGTVATEYEVPVPSIREFLYDERYLGRINAPKDDSKVGLFDFWAKEMEYVLNPENKILEVLVQSSIGSGKTVFSLECMCFGICKLLCMRNPQQFYGLMPQTRIVFFIFSVTENMAFNVCYQQLSEMLNLSPFFKERLLLSRGASIHLPKHLAIEIGSQFGQHVGGGESVIFALLDESNFGSGAIARSQAVKLARAKAADNYHLSRVMRAYNNFLRRMESRFQQNDGTVDGQLIMVASAGSENAALSKHIEDTRKRGVKTSHVIEAPIWEVQAYRRGKPTEKFARDTFRLLKGDRYVDPRILGPNEAVPDGYSVISVPMNYYGAFTANLDDAMRDIANVASAPSNRLIRNRERLHACVDFVRPIPFRTDLIYLDFDDDSEIQDYMSMLVFKDYMKILNELGISNYSVHIDTGLTGDALGIALSHSSGLIEVPGVDLTGRTVTEWKQLYTNDFVIKIHNVQNKEIPLFKVVRFILWLKNEFGLQFVTVSTDGFQQSAILQLLQTQGIPCRILSVDRDDTPYTIIKSCIYDKRISLYNYQPLVTELLELIHYTDIRKVDHPEGGCFAGGTLIMVNGKPHTLGQLKAGEEFETLGCQKDGTIITVKAKALGVTKVVTELCQVGLSNGVWETCTPDHKWMLISGEYAEARTLKEGDTLMSRYRMKKRTKVEKVQLWRGSALAVYDISSPETGNFCLASGVFVHNSKDVADALTGSIFNLTDISLPAIKKQSETGADIPYIFQRDIEKEMRKRDRAERDEFWPDIPKNLW